MSLKFFSLKYLSSKCFAVNLSHAISKYACIAGLCKSHVITLSTPAASNNFAINFAVTGILGWSFLSDLEYIKYGNTTVILLAEALLAASTVINNSIILSFTGGIVVWTINTSWSLTVSFSCTKLLSFWNLNESFSPNGKFKQSHISFVNSSAELQAKILISFMISPLKIIYIFVDFYTSIFILTLFWNLFNIFHLNI